MPRNPKMEIGFHVTSRPFRLSDYLIGSGTGTDEEVRNETL